MPRLSYQATTNNNNEKINNNNEACSAKKRKRITEIPRKADIKDADLEDPKMLEFIHSLYENCMEEIKDCPSFRTSTRNKIETALFESTSLNSELLAIAIKKIKETEILKLKLEREIELRQEQTRINQELQNNTTSNYNYIHNTTNLNKNNNKSNTNKIINNNKSICIIDPKKDNISYADICKKFNESKITSEKKVNINKIVPTKRSGKYIIELATKNDKKVLLENNKILDDIAEIREPKLKATKLVIKGIDQNLTPEKFKEEIYTRDKRFENEDEIEIIKEIKREGSLFKTIIMKINGETTEKLNNYPYLYIGLKRHTLHKYIPRLQCFKCAEIGHTKHNCQKEDKCTKCSKNHTFDVCTIENEEEYKCANCIYFNSKCKKESEKVSINHNSRIRSCPSWQRYLKKMNK